MDAIVVGAGWAGLSAAVRLAQHGRRVLILEAAAQPGGRARSVTIDGRTLDNGQHLLLGAYHELLALLQTIDVDADQHLRREPLRLHYRNAAGADVTLAAPHLPAPLHLAAALARCSGLSISERRAALTLAARMALLRYRVADDLPLADWLRQHRQPANVVTALWEPLCLGALNTPLQSASTQVFLTVLHDAFTQRRSDSDLLVPRTDLQQLLPTPATTYLQQHHAELKTRARVIALLTDQQRVIGVRTANSTYTASQVVLALPPNRAAALLDDLAPGTSLHAQLAGFDYTPICTVYLGYATAARVDGHYHGLLHSTAQWVFDRRLTGNAGTVAVVISGPGEHMQWSNAVLIDKVSEELATCYPQWPRHQWGKVIREKRATFACTAGINQRRPDNHTDIAGHAGGRGA